MSLPPTSPVPPSSLATARSASRLQLSSPSPSSSSTGADLQLAPPSLSSPHPPSSPSSVASDWSPPKDESSPPPSDGLSDSFTASQFISHDDAREAEEEHRQGRRPVEKKEDGGTAVGAMAAAGGSAPVDPSPTATAASLWSATLRQVAEERRGEEKKAEAGEEAKEGTGDGRPAEAPVPSGEEMAAKEGGELSCEAERWSGRVSSLLSSLSLSSSSSALPLCLFSLSLVCLGFLLGHRYGRHSERLLQQRGGGERAAGGVRGIAEVVGGLMKAMAAEQEKQLTRLIGAGVAVNWTGQR